MNKFPYDVIQKEKKVFKQFKSMFCALKKGQKNRSNFIKLIGLFFLFLNDVIRNLLRDNKGFVAYFYLLITV